MMKLAMVLGVLLLGTSPAAAVGFQSVYDFESEGIGTAGLLLGSTPVNTLSGGVVATSVGAYSGTQVYRGMVIDLVVEDELDYDWPGIAAYITGADAVTLTGWHYNPDTLVEDYAGSVSLAAVSFNQLLELGTEMDIVWATRWQFSSTSEFTLDDLTVGLVNVPGGIPEPAAWTLMIAGFGLTGAAMRRRQRSADSAA